MTPYQIVITYTDQNDTQTTGDLEVYSDRLLFVAKVLTLPWKENRQNISRIPSNHYEAQKLVHHRLGKSIWIKNVPDRTGIFLHHANFYHQGLGCIFVGEDLIDIDDDGHKDVTNSEQTMNELYDTVRDPLYVNIIENFKNKL